MNYKTMKVLLALLLAIGLTTTAFAQRQTGSIAGTVHDADGSPLPGATVTAISPALMGDASFITSDRGTFRFPALPPGTYTLRIELPGFTTLMRQGVVVNVGKTTTVDVNMQMAAIEEEITVVGASPIVDISSSKVSVSYTPDLIKNIPMGRDLYDLLASAPGVVSENVTYRRTISTHGSSVRGNQYAFDGFMMNDPVVSYLASNINFDAFDEVEMELTAHPAEVGQTDGAYINVVTKSGGNRVSGMVQGYFTNETLVDTNFTPHQIESFRSISPITPAGEVAVAPYSVLTDYDFSAQIGGPLIKDKLWFFGAFRYFDWKRNYSGFNDPNTNKPVDVTHTEWSAQAKLTWQVASNHKFTVNYYRTNLTEPYMTLDVSPYVMPEGAAKWEGEYSDVIYGKWNWILSQSTFLDIRVGYINRYFPEFMQDELGPQFDYGIYGNPHIDYSTGFYYGTSRFGEIYNRGRMEFLGSLTHFIDDLGGFHEIKMGFEHERAKGTWETWLPNEPRARFLTVNYKYMWEDWGLPYGYVSAYAIGSEHGQSDEINQMYRWSAYLQDAWTIGNRVTLNLGVRWDYSYGYIPPQTNVGNPFWQNIIDNGDLVWLTEPQPLYFAPKEYPEYKDYMSWNTFTPRVGLTWDPFGDGKTAVKGSYSRYSAMMMLQFTSLPNPNYIHTGDFNWYDLNENNWPDLDDFYEFVWLSREEDPQTGLPDLSKEVDPDLSPPYVDEATIGIEREIVADFSVGLTYIRKWERNMIESYPRPDKETIWTEDTWSEPGEDGEWNTGDDISFPVYIGSGDFPATWSTNIDGTDGKPTAERNYQGLQLTINKRMSNNWQFFGSVVISKAEGNLGQSYGESYGARGRFVNPNYLTNQYGRLNMERPLVINLSGTYQAPLGFNISAIFSHYSGYPYQRYFRVYGLDPWASYRYINTLPYGTGEYREPSRDNVDIRIEKLFTWEVVRLGIFLDIFNALNSGYVDYYHGYSGRVYYGQEGRYVEDSRHLNEIRELTGPRTFKLSVRVTF
jgi:hypothetical protein